MTTQIELLQQIFAALGAAIATYTGQNIGAGKHKRVSLGVTAAMKISHGGFRHASGGVLAVRSEL